MSQSTPLNLNNVVSSLILPSELNLIKGRAEKHRETARFENILGGPGRGHTIHACRRVEWKALNKKETVVSKSITRRHSGTVGNLHQQHIETEHTELSERMSLNIVQTTHQTFMLPSTSLSHLCVVMFERLNLELEA